MTPWAPFPGPAADHWSRVEQLFAALLDVPEEERHAVLETEGHSDIRSEVETLLAVHRDLASGDVEGDPFLERLDSGRARALLERSGSDGEEPETVGRYRIVRRLGRGGMGVVYEAHDPGLDRSVALKLLPPRLSADPAAARRLIAEARTACVLDHPHIATVYEIGATADGRVFIAMACYDGETVRQRSARGPIPVPEVVDLGVQLAEGLSAAHRRGIIHCDIKPENLLVTRDGVLKIVDFGVATVLGDGPTSGGRRFGTAAYMSPEQVRGGRVDQRTDLWSMGVVLYELLAGARPFSGEGETLLQAICHDAPRRLPGIRHDLPTAAASVIERCLEKDPTRRFDTADAVATELRRASGGAAATSAAGRPHVVRRTGRASQLEGTGFWTRALETRPWRVLRPSLLPLSLLLVLVGMYVLLHDPDRTLSRQRALAVTALPGIAVLPFDVKGAGLDIWREGMVDLLSANLDGVAGLRAIDSRTVLARWREAVQKAGVPDLEKALEVARGTGARYAVIGSVVSSGSGMRLGARIHSLPDGRSLASLHVEGPPDSVFALVDRLSIDVLAAIWQGREQPRGDVDLARITTSSLPALKAYLEGESLLRRAEFDGAIAAYERAIAADSTFAFAVYHLGLAYAWAADGTEGDLRLMTESFERAMRHVRRLPEREALLLRAALAYHTGAQEVVAIDLLREATRRYPDEADAWFLLGESTFHVGEEVLAGQDESEKALRKAVELDPGFALSYVHLVNNAFIHHPDSARAARLIDAYHRLAPKGVFGQDNRVAFELAFGDSTRRRQAFAALDTLPLGILAHLSSGFLDHPRFWATREAVLEARPRPATPTGRFMTFQLFDNSLSRGELRAALAHLEGPLMYSGLRAAGLYTINSAGLPVRGAAVDAVLALARSDSLPTDVGSTLILFYAGAYAADHERWQDHAAAHARLRAHAERLLAAGDSADSRFAMGATLALKGQGLWRRGEARRALPLLVDGQRQAIWSSSPSRRAVNGTIRWWLGELLLELGRPGEAALHFESFWNDPRAADRLARIYEQMGDLARARDAYALVASAWKDADPELQSRAREALAAVQRLTSPGRE